MRYIFYYLTEDSSNTKEKNELNYLRAIGRVVVVTRGAAPIAEGTRGIKRLELPSQPSWYVSALFLWTKICFLLCRLVESQTVRRFPERNSYTGQPWARWLVNRIWPAKRIGAVNRLLPGYETLYLAPFRFARLFVRDKKRSVERFQRIVVHDALILRLTGFTPFILMARCQGFRTVANVKSWDNPFYSQFIESASGYLTWSESMWGDVRRLHRVGRATHHVWGPRPFFEFANATRSGIGRSSRATGTLVLGYAAAYCDTLMAAHEVKVIYRIAEELSARGAEVKILFRPYPIVPTSSYDALRGLPNIEVADIPGPVSDRYGDGRELIRFGSDKERAQFLSRCDCFLSIGTSFTFEAALFGLPVLQFFPRKEQRTSEHEIAFFGRLDISDHIQRYFLEYLPVANDTEDLFLVGPLAGQRRKRSCSTPKDA
jgi:hypothetical protein